MVSSGKQYYTLIVDFTVSLVVTSEVSRVVPPSALPFAKLDVSAWRAFKVCCSLGTRKCKPV